MKRNTDRILTTHTGSLPRTAKVIELLLAEQRNRGSRKTELNADVGEAIAVVAYRSTAHDGYRAGPEQVQQGGEQKLYVLGLTHLRARDVRLITADGHELTSDKDEMTEAMLAIGAVFAGLEKKRLVKKVRAARDRKSQEKGRRIEGRSTLAPLHQRFPEAVAMAKRLYRANPKSGLMPSSKWLRRLA